MQNQEPPTRRWPFRLIAAAPGCLVSAIFVATQIPAVREAIGIAKTTYGFINSTVPSLGVAAIWIGFVLLVGGVVATWWSHRSIKDATTKMMAVGSAVLAVALGVLVAVVSTFNHPGAPSTTIPPTYLGSIVTHHHQSPRRYHHHTPAHHPSTGGSKPAGTATPSPAPSTPSVPAPAPAPSPPSGGGSSSSSGGTGGNGATVTVNKNNHQEATSGAAEGSGATSGPATNNNNEGPVSISVG